MRIKEELDPLELTMLHASLYPVLGLLMQFCYTHNVPCVITSLIRSDSSSHKTGRAVDVSIKGWKEIQIEAFKHMAEVRYGYLGAYSKSDNKQRLVVDHGPVRHLHLQVKP